MMNTRKDSEVEIMREEWTVIKFKELGISVSASSDTDSIGNF